MSVGTVYGVGLGPGVGVTSAGPRNYLRLDRPFLFAITENSSKSILFMGKVAEPSYE